LVLHFQGFQSMRTFCRMWFLGVLGLLVPVLAGCGDGLGTLHPVSGSVTLDGEPLKDAQLSFVPDTEKGNKTTASVFGKVTDGKYTLTTKDRPGAPAGHYKVSVLTQYPGGPENPVVLLKIYSDPGKSGLKVEVVEKPSPGAYDLKLTSK
jgi:hypothetical protein